MVYLWIERAVNAGEISLHRCSQVLVLLLWARVLGKAVRRTVASYSPTPPSFQHFGRAERHAAGDQLQLQPHPWYIWIVVSLQRLDGYSSVTFPSLP